MLDQLHVERSAAVLKDVLGHSIAEIAEIESRTAPAANSPLQRGRLRLQEVVEQDSLDVVLPRIDEDSAHRLAAYVQAFRKADFDTIR